MVGVPSEKVTISTLPIHFNKVLTGSHDGDAVMRTVVLLRADELLIRAGFRVGDRSLVARGRAGGTL